MNINKILNLDLETIEKDIKDMNLVSNQLFDLLNNWVDEKNYKYFEHRYMDYKELYLKFWSLLIDISPELLNSDKKFEWDSMSDIVSLSNFLLLSTLLEKSKEHYILRENIVNNIFKDDLVLNRLSQNTKLELIDTLKWWLELLMNNKNQYIDIYNQFIVQYNKLMIESKDNTHYLESLINFNIDPELEAILFLNQKRKDI